MYETYFNLSQRPFAAVPRVDHYFPAATIDSARTNLIRCVERAEGAATAIGPSGVGKTLLCQVLAEHFRNTFAVALLTGTALGTRRALLQAILYELKLPYRGMDEGELRLALVDRVTLSGEQPGGMLLMVDDAHHLPLRLLDEIRGLTNLMRGGQPAVRLILVGGRGLEERFASPKLESFSQRLAARCYLEAFQWAETQDYIHARLAACGADGPQVFPPETCQRVHKATDGVPRLVNQVCDHVMLLACAAGQKRIEPQHIDEAWADLQQLPTPWNEPQAATGQAAIEFGNLEDEPAAAPGEAPPAAADALPIAAPSAECPPTLLRISSGIDESEAAAADPAEQLHRIQQILADVEDDFQPAGSIGPEVELALDDPAHPFSERFAEEEVITDHYVAAAEPHRAGEQQSRAAGEQETRRRETRRRGDRQTRRQADKGSRRAEGWRRPRRRSTRPRRMAPPSRRPKPCPFTGRPVQHNSMPRNSTRTTRI